MRDRRRSQRLATSLAVTLHVGGGGRVLRGLSQDVSRSGLFVLTQDVIGEGSRVDLFIDHGSQPLSLSGVVVHLLRGYGVGIRFNPMSATNQQRLQRLVDELRELGRSAG